MVAVEACQLVNVKCVDYQTYSQQTDIMVCGYYFGLFLMSSRSYQLDVQKKSCVASGNPQWGISKTRTSPYLAMVIGGVCLLSPSLTDRCSQSCLLFNVQWFIKFEDILQSLLTSVFMMFILWSATQWNIGVQWRKVIK